MASLVIGPTNRNPDRHRDEHQYARINLAQTAVLVAAGGGQIKSIDIGVVGTLARFYDTPSGGTTDDTTEIMTVSLATIRTISDIDLAFSKGLTVVVTGSGVLTVSFDAAQTVSARTFGTQLDGNAGRASGTSTDKAMAN